MRIKALDSIRGILLLLMTLVHFGRPISQYIYQRFGFFSEAEGFFFLSGFVGMLAATSKAARDPSQTWMRSRGATIWKYHCMTLLGLCLMAMWFLPSLSPYFKVMTQHPVEGIFWSALLVNTPRWFDVLPLYAIFLAIGSVVYPLFVNAKTLGRICLLWTPSLVIWIGAQFGLRNAINSLFPSWIVHGDFDPFAWQFLYFTGAAVAAWWKRAKACNSQTAVQVVHKLTPVAIAALIFFYLWSQQAIPLPLPADFLTDKVIVGPVRAVNFFCLVLVIGWIIRTWPSALDFKPLNLIGRHSLDVYTAHIVLVYLWFATPGTIRYREPWDILIPLMACALLWGLSKIREPRK